MNRTPAEVLTAHFASLLLCTRPEDDADGLWPATVDFLPDDPDNALSLYNTSGNLDGRIQSSGEVIQHPGIQIRVRALDSAEGYLKIKELALAMNAVKRALVAFDDEFYTIHAIKQTSDIFSIGKEPDGNRFWFSVNGTITISWVAL